MAEKKEGQNDRDLAGFTIVELLITLVIAVLYITIFFQLYTLSDTITTSTYQLAQADQITYRKVQQYENRSFAAIPILNGSTPTQVEDFTSELPTTLPSPYSAVVLTAQITPNLKAITVRTTYGPSGSAQRVIEFADYIQQSGLGR
jgi:type II secretory pathway pseudopilin PulG